MEPIDPKLLTPKDALAATFDTWETHLAGRVGLTFEEMRALRKAHLTGGEHFATVGRRICYSRAGVEALGRVLAMVDLAKNAATPQSDTARDGGPTKTPVEPVRLIVYRAGLKNTRIIEAYLPGTDPQVPAKRLRVTVRDARNFVPGMAIPARLVNGALYELARACPRTKGKW